MKESEYIKATNTAKASAALSILKGVQSGKDYGVSKKELQEVMVSLCEIEEKLLKNVLTLF